MPSGTMPARVQVRSREPRLDAGLIDTARTILQDAVTLDGALLALGRTVAPRLDVWWISVRMIDWRASEVVIVGVWARAGTVLEAGTRIPAAQTALSEMLRTGRPVIYQGDEETASLLHRIRASEGMRSWVTIPLHESGPSLAFWPCRASISAPSPNRMCPTTLPWEKGSKTCC